MNNGEIRELSMIFDASLAGASNFQTRFQLIDSSKLRFSAPRVTHCSQDAWVLGTAITRR